MKWLNSSFVLGFTLVATLSATPLRADGTVRLPFPVGAQEGHGGDMCEDRIKTVRDDIESWIKKGGSKYLKLPTGVSVQQYNQLMLDKMARAQVKCTDISITVSGVEKTCKNWIDGIGRPQISCNVHRLMSETTDSEQYVLIHHEYAGLAGIEKGVGSSSDYSVSNQISGFLENEWIKKLAVAPKRGVIEHFKFVNIPLSNLCGSAVPNSPGCFWMGSVKPEENVLENWPVNEPKHKVILTQPFQLQTTLVTQKLWFDVMGNNPSYFSTQDACPTTFVTLQNSQGESIGMCPENPVEQVSFDPLNGDGGRTRSGSVVEFLERLNARGDGFHYDLPTEAEWEYAARARLSPNDLKNDKTQLDLNAWWWTNSTGRSHEVAHKSASSLGLYDMQGNVWEWVSDWYAADYGVKHGSISKDPQGPTGPLPRSPGNHLPRGNPGESGEGWWTPPPPGTPTQHVVRGGSFHSEVDQMRITTRLGRDPFTVNPEIGFRLSRRVR